MSLFPKVSKRDRRSPRRSPSRPSTLQSNTFKIRRYTAALRDDRHDPDGRLSPLSADCPMTFTPLAAEPVVCAILLTLSVAIPRRCGIVFLSLERFHRSAFLGLLL